MNIPKQERETRQVELVETLNLYRSLARLRAASHASHSLRWKRALYHAIGMLETDRQTTERIRQALELP